jgi:hypothetical protein
MSEDWIEKTLRRSVNLYGREMTSDELASEFLKCDINARVDILDSMASDEPDELTPRQAARRMGYTRSLLNAHERARKADR